MLVKVARMLHINGIKVYLLMTSRIRSNKTFWTLFWVQFTMRMKVASMLHINGIKVYPAANFFLKIVFPLILLWNSYGYYITTFPRILKTTVLCRETLLFFRVRDKLSDFSTLTMFWYPSRQGELERGQLYLIRGWCNSL